MCLTLIPLLVGGLFVMENWLGARQLKRAKARVAAAGIELDLRRLPPARPPDDENFCATPLLRAIGEGRHDDPLVDLVKRVAEAVEIARFDGGPSLQWANSPQETDWMAFHEAIRTSRRARARTRSWSEQLREGETDPVSALWEFVDREMAPVTAELMAVIDRPKAVMIPTYQESMAIDPVSLRPSWAVGYSHYPGHAYRLRAALAEARGEDRAFVDSCRLILRLAEAMESEASLWGARAGAAVRGLCHAAIWSAAANRRLTGETYRELATLMRGTPGLDALPAAIQQEMRILQAVHEATEIDRVRKFSLLAHGDPFSDFEQWQEMLIGVMPHGWFEANHAAFLAAALELLSLIQDSSISGRFDLKEQTAAEISKARTFPFHWMAAAGFLRDSRNPIRHIASSHAVTRMAEAACALEAYFADHQAYPDSLPDLVPAFLPALPLDLDGKPLRYARDPGNERYMLWSIGSDGIDDGGVEMAEGGGKPKVWGEPVGDWVWRYP